MKIFQIVRYTWLFLLPYLFASGQPDVAPVFFGDIISTEQAVTLNDVKGQLTDLDTIGVTISGEVAEVCQAKGCWMTLISPDQNNTVFIRFKDYAFFVPKDSGGKIAYVEGLLFNHLTPVDELRHYAKDKGATDEEISQITEPKTELRMMANGVAILP